MISNKFTATINMRPLKLLWQTDTSLMSCQRYVDTLNPVAYTIHEPLSMNMVPRSSTFDMNLLYYKDIDFVFMHNFT